MGDLLNFKSFTLHLVIFSGISLQEEGLESWWGVFVCIFVWFMLKTSCKPLLQSLWLQEKRNQSLTMKALALAVQMLCSALWCWPTVLHTNPQPLEGREFHLPTFMCKMMIGSGFPQTEAVLGREGSSAASFILTHSTLSSNKTQALGRACLFPSMPSLALSFSLPVQGDLITGPERGTALWTFYFFFPTYLSLTCTTSEHLHLISESKWAAQGSC